VDGALRDFFYFVFMILMGCLSYGRFDYLRGQVPTWVFKLLYFISRFCSVGLIAAGVFGLAALLLLD
jgi:hypothetical protein